MRHLILGYIDPSSMSIIASAVAAVFISGGVAIAAFWQKIKSFYARLFRNKPKEKIEDDVVEDEEK